MLFWKIYILTSILYGIYSLCMQYLRHPKFCQWQNMLLVFVFNTVLMPVSIIIAIVKKTLLPVNLIRGLADQLPLSRAYRNFFVTRNAWGLLHPNSHFRQDTGKPKVGYRTKTSALKAAESMRKKNGVHYSVYKCVFCDDYHLGRNRDNKITGTPVGDKTIMMDADGRTTIIENQNFVIKK